MKRLFRILGSWRSGEKRRLETKEQKGSKTVPKNNTKRDWRKIIENLYEGRIDDDI